MVFPNKKRFNLSLLIIFFVLYFSPLSAAADFKRINKPNPKDPMAVAIYELDNGLKVYLTENHEKPRFCEE